MIILHNQHTDQIQASTALTDLCERNDNFYYYTLRNKKFPFDYKGWRFEKVDSFEVWYNEIREKTKTK